ncbi:hypothetical protein BK025_08295 [Sodalis sp. TME1]|nr:hypothetical protein BK025_08295 [Sodalis sp. TME1]
MPLPLHDEAGIHGPAPRGYGRGVPSSPPVAVVRDENDKNASKAMKTFDHAWHEKCRWACPFCPLRP